MEYAKLTRLHEKPCIHRKSAARINDGTKLRDQLRCLKIYTDRQDTVIRQITSPEPAVRQAKTADGRHHRYT